jgi:hypothetical protein
MSQLESRNWHERHTPYVSILTFQDDGQMTTRSTGVMRVRLLRKLADRLDGIDLSDCEEGDIIDLPRTEAQLLIEEQWALPFQGPRGEVRRTSTSPERVAAADRSHTRTVAQLRRVRDEMETRRCEPQERRRAEDWIREELHDSRAKTVNDHQ